MRSDPTLACELRDGLLQDLLAVGLLIEGARACLRDGSTDEAELLLSHAATAVGCGVEELRAVIGRVRFAA